MYGVILGLALSTVGVDDHHSEWEILCECPMSTLRRDIAVTPKLNWPVPGAPTKFIETSRPWISVSLLPDIIEFNEAGVSSSLSYSFSPETRGLKGELLKRLGLVEMRSRGFGATLRFSGAPNLAFQFRGRRRLTVAYITKF